MYTKLARPTLFFQMRRLGMSYVDIGVSGMQLCEIQDWHRSIFFLIILVYLVQPTEYNSIKFD